MTLEADYAAAHDVAALFDASAAGKLLLTGPDAPKLVHNISTNAVVNLALGAGCETFFCDARAKALYFAAVYHVKTAGEHALWLDTAPGFAAGLAKHLDRYLISEDAQIADVTADYAQFHLAGPKAADVLARLLGEPLPELGELQHVERTLGNDITAGIRRRSRLGVRGFDVVVPKQNGDAAANALVAAGAAFASAEAYEVLRVEAGTPLQGVDFDATRFVMEVGNAARAVSYAKGCFPGQEPIVMARDRAGRVNRQFLRLSPDADLAPGTPLLADGKDVGLITSAARSPRLGPIAAGYVHWTQATPGTVLQTPAGVAVRVTTGG